MSNNQQFDRLDKFVVVRHGIRPDADPSKDNKYPIISSNAKDQRQYFDCNVWFRGSGLIIRKSAVTVCDALNNVVYLEGDHSFWLDSDCLYLTERYASGYDDKKVLKFVNLYLFKNKDLVDSLYTKKTHEGDPKIFVKKVSEIQIPDIPAECMKKLVIQYEKVLANIELMKKSLKIQKNCFNKLEKEDVIPKLESNIRKVVTGAISYVTIEELEHLEKLMFTDEYIFDFAQKN